MADKHTKTGSFRNDYGQVTETCSCGAAVDSHEAHLLDVARQAKREQERQAELKALKS